MKSLVQKKKLSRSQQRLSDYILQTALKIFDEQVGLGAETHMKAKFVLS